MAKTATEWAKELIGTNSINGTAARCPGINTPTLFRQIQKNAVTMETVVALAYGHGLSAIDALTECGFITREDYETNTNLGTLKNATDQDIVQEILNRLKTRNPKQ